MNTRSPESGGGRLPYVFFGTGTIAAGVLGELERAGLLPVLVVTAPDKPLGRGGALTPSPVGAWAAARSIEMSTPERLDADFLASLQAAADKRQVPLFVVVDYGKLLPGKLLDIPRRGTLNMHPSLLPRLRGPSPIRSAILNDERTVGVSVMLVDEKMDHGPIVAQRIVAVPQWPPRGSELDELLSHEGGKLLAEVLPQWAAGAIESTPQEHEKATFTKLFKKEDGLLDLSAPHTAGADAYKSLLKIRAFEGWPGTYAFFERGGKRFRMQILDAHLDAGGALILDTVKPEGKNAMPYADFARSGALPAR
ncbi:methionyl-tRNA formyltransferase [Candidatus Kaiserbacteria bacterium CG10_big_fil_rev_8_21_14_0_10_59_10]|uniref:methionyl-tRNA formyltransferase n=1 Tax=Candidatus Kaiserbacteria bacterium CG10_big_fil_rev_8_21_14_0_10_59_10 TaxID=1974612 RepID=A0A2H0U8X8_9BACT|nr:MAG: methionyl-tRNA formyltransferase [Candidatus Kaiserbacteria bacterium CG10_big_fil_rev_8_21_14_0_10_59_10]